MRKNKGCQKAVTHLTDRQTKTYYNKNNITLTIHTYKVKIMREEEVKGLDGEWLILLDNNVVERSDSAEEIFKLAKERYSDKDVIVTKVLSANASFY
ncbi:MAG: DUF5678 domain-containing protein [Thermoplasmatales archaeon]|nr:DUF5678 domain-containing protein [Thermoplasmatales archaeon]